MNVRKIKAILVIVVGLHVISAMAEPVDLSLFNKSTQTLEATVFGNGTEKYQIKPNRGIDVRAKDDYKGVQIKYGRPDNHGQPYITIFTNLKPEGQIIYGSASHTIFDAHYNDGRYHIIKGSDYLATTFPRFLHASIPDTSAQYPGIIFESHIGKTDNYIDIEFHDRHY